MGVNGLKTFIADQPHSRATWKKCKFPRQKRSSRTVRQTVIVDGHGCVRKLYGHLDWLRGGSWRELRALIKSWVTGWNEAGFDLVFFFDGGDEDAKMAEHVKRMRKRLHEKAKVMTSVASGAEPPFKLLTLPSGTADTIAAALRDCGVQVLYSLGDGDREMAAYAITHAAPTAQWAINGRRGGWRDSTTPSGSLPPLPAPPSPVCSVLVDDSDFFILGVPYWALGSLRVGKRFVEVQSFASDVLSTTLGLVAPLHRALFASLVGNDFVTPASLAGFHARLLGLSHGEKAKKAEVIEAVAAAVAAVVEELTREAMDEASAVSMLAGLSIGESSAAASIGVGGDGAETAAAAAAAAAAARTRAVDAVADDICGVLDRTISTHFSRTTAALQARRRSQLATSISCYDTQGSDSVFAAMVARRGIPIELVLRHRLGSLPSMAVETLLCRRVDEPGLKLEEAALRGGGGGSGGVTRTTISGILAPIKKRMLAFILASVSMGEEGMCNEELADGRPVIPLADRSRMLHVLTTAVPTSVRRGASHLSWGLLTLDPMPTLAGGLGVTRGSPNQLSALLSMLHCDDVEDGRALVEDVANALAESMCVGLRGGSSIAEGKGTVAAIVCLALRYVIRCGALQGSEVVALLVHSLWCLANPGMFPKSAPFQFWKKSKKSKKPPAKKSSRRHGATKTDMKNGIDVRTVHVISLWTSLMGRACKANALAGTPLDEGGDAVDGGRGAIGLKLSHDIMAPWRWFDGKLCATTLRLASAGSKQSPILLHGLGKGGKSSSLPRQIGFVTKVIARQGSPFGFIRSEGQDYYFNSGTFNGGGTTITPRLTKTRVSFVGQSRGDGKYTAAKVKSLTTAEEREMRMSAAAAGSSAAVPVAPSGDAPAAIDPLVLALCDGDRGLAATAVQLLARIGAGVAVGGGAKVPPSVRLSRRSVAAKDKKQQQHSGGVKVAAAAANTGSTLKRGGGGRRGQRKPPAAAGTAQQQQQRLPPKAMVAPPSPPSSSSSATSGFLVPSSVMQRMPKKEKKTKE